MQRSTLRKLTSSYDQMRRIIIVSRHEDSRLAHDRGHPRVVGFERKTFHYLTFEANAHGADSRVRRQPSVIKPFASTKPGPRRVEGENNRAVVVLGFDRGAKAREGNAVTRPQPLGRTAEGEQATAA